MVANALQWSDLGPIKKVVHLLFLADHHLSLLPFPFFLPISTPFLLLFFLFLTTPDTLSRTVSAFPPESKALTGMGDKSKSVTDQPTIQLIGAGARDACQESKWCGQNTSIAGHDGIWCEEDCLLLLSHSVSSHQCFNHLFLVLFIILVNVYAMQTQIFTENSYLYLTHSLQIWWTQIPSNRRESSNRGLYKPLWQDQVLYGRDHEGERFFLKKKWNASALFLQHMFLRKAHIVVICVFFSNLETRSQVRFRKFII